MSSDLISLQVEQVWRHEHEAIKALSEGRADEYQQGLALSVIVNKFSRAHDMGYIPDSFDQTAFLAGRSFVGKQIVKYTKLSVSKTPEVDNEPASD